MLASTQKITHAHNNMQVVFKTSEHFRFLLEKLMILHFGKTICNITSSFAHISVAKLISFYLSL